MTAAARILVLGGTGMLGHTLFDCLDSERDLEVHATARDPATLEGHVPPEKRCRLHGGCDAASDDGIRRVLDSVRPHTVVNCIGVVKQGPAVPGPTAAMDINADLPPRLAQLCARSGTRLIHISTDCVFSGTKGAYVETDLPDPVDAYGRTKLLGEPTDPGCLTLRTSFIGHELRRRRGLLEWFLAQKGPIDGYTRAIFSGLTTIEIARVLSRFVLPNATLRGIYHMSGAPISKFELLGRIAHRYGHRIEIRPCDHPVLDRSLDSTRFRAETGYDPPGWPELIDAMFHDHATRYRSGIAGSHSPPPGAARETE